MREIRTPDECITDKILYLILMDLAARQRSGVIGNRIKCMKLPFLVEYPMFEDKAKGFNMVYFQYEHGPISKHVYEIWRDLEEAGCIAFQNRIWLELTDHGHRVADDVISELLHVDQNSYFFDRIEDTAKKYGSRDNITPVVYAMDVYAQELGSRMKVREAPVGVTFTCVLEDAEAVKQLRLPQSWLETLAVELNPANIQSVTNALEDYRVGRILSHDKVWESV